MADDGQVKVRIDGEVSGFSQATTQATHELDKISGGANRVNEELRVVGGGMDYVAEAAKKAAAATTGVSEATIETATATAGQLVPALGLVLGVLAAGAAAAVALGVAYRQGAAESKALNEALILSGNSAGATFGQLNMLAASVADTSHTTQGAVAEVLQSLVASGKVSGEVLDVAAQAAVSMSRATGMAAGDVAKQFAELGGSPLQASLKLNESTNFLTAALVEQISALERHGQKAEAAAVAQRAFAESQIHKAAEIEQHLGTVETYWRALKEVATGAWDAMLGVGRKNSLEEQLATAKQDLANNSFIFGSRADKETEIAVLEAAVKAQQEQALAAKDNKEATEATASWLKTGLDYRTKDQKLSDDINQAINLGIAAHRTNEEIAQRVLDIRQKYAKVSKASADNDLKQYERLKEAMAADDAGVSPQTLKGLDTLAKLLDAGKISVDQYNKAMGFLIDNDAKLKKEQTDLDKALAAGQKTIDDYVSKLDESADKLERETEYLYRKKSAVEWDTVAEYENARAIAAGLNLGPQVLETYDRIIEARRRIATAMDQKEVLEADKKAADAAAKEWETVTNDVSRALADAIMNGGAHGGELLKRYFQTLVLTPTIKALMAPVSNAVGSMLGFNPSSASTATSIASAAGLDISKLLGLGSYAQTGSIGTGLYGAFATSGVGQMLGLSTTTALPVAAEDFIAGGGLGGATSTTTLTGLGSGIASALPWVAGALGIASAFGLFDHKGGPKISGQGLAVFGDNGTYTTPDTWDISNPTTKPGRWYGTQVWDGSANSQMQSGMDAFAAGVSSYLKKLGLTTSGLAFGIGGDSDPQGTAGDFVRASVVRNGTEVYSREYDAGRGNGQAAIETELQRMLLATIKSAGNNLYSSVIGSRDISAASSSEVAAMLADIQSLGTVMGTLKADPFKDYTDSLSAANNKYVDLLNRQRDAVLAAASAYDGSSQSITDIANLTQQRYQMELQLAAQIDSAVKSIEASYAGARQQIELAGLTSDQTVAYWTKRQEELKTAMASQTEVGDIQTSAQKLEEAIMAAYSAMDPSRQLAEKDAYLQKLADAEAASVSAAEQIKTQQADANRALNDQIMASMNTVATNMAAQVEAAGKAAAAAIEKAASAIPKQVVINTEANLPVIGGWNDVG